MELGDASVAGTMEGSFLAPDMHLSWEVWRSTFTISERKSTCLAADPTHSLECG